MAMLLLALLALLGSVQVGYSFYLKREAQKTADLAALSAVQLLGSGTENECTDAKARAGKVAGQNLDGAALDPAPECGRLEINADTHTCSTTLPPYPADAALPGNACAFGAANEGKPYNALRVVVRKDAAQLIPRLGGNGEPHTVEARAIALSSEPTAAFSVESRLLNVRSDGLLAAVLTTAGVSPSRLTVLDSAGLAQAQVTPSGLLQALGLPANLDLGAGTPAELADLTVGGFLDLMATVLARNSRIPASDGQALGDFIDLVRNDAGGLDLNRHIDLIGLMDENGQGGEASLIRLAPGIDPASALSTGVRVADLIAGAVAVANGQNTAKLNLSVPTPLLNVEAKAHIVKPPAFAMGGVGTTAHSAQVRLDLTAKPPSGSLLATVLPDGLRLIAGVADGDATVQSIRCNAPPTPREASFSAASRLTSLCLAPPGAADDYSCREGSGSIPVNLLGFNINIPSRNLLELSRSESFTLKEPPDGEHFHTINAIGPGGASGPNPTGDQLANALVGGLLGSLAQVTVTDSKRHDLAAALLNQHGTVANVRDALQSYRGTLEQLRSNNQQTGLLLPALQTTLGTVTGLLSGIVTGLSSVVTDLLKNLLCALSTECKINRIKDEALNNDNYAGGIAAIAIGLLQPLLQPLGQVLDALLDTLGVGLGETDVMLHDVQCGIPRLIE